MAENEIGSEGEKPLVAPRRFAGATKTDIAALSGESSPDAPLPRSSLNLVRTITVINEMQSKGVIGRYAIGGAIGATFYLEPISTADVDVFVALLPQRGSLLSVSPIYEYLQQRGYSAIGDGVTVEDWLVQFLPAINPLVEEAIGTARRVEIEAVPTSVFTAEHLVAIALQTGRAKDRARILQFIEGGAIREEELNGILNRHGLAEKWANFKRLFLDTPL